MRKHGNSISMSKLAKTLVPDLSRYFTLSLNRTSRNYVGFDSLITNDLGAIDRQLPRGINAITLVATARAFLSDNLISFSATQTQYLPTYIRGALSSPFAVASLRARVNVTRHFSAIAPHSPRVNRPRFSVISRNSTGQGRIILSHSRVIIRARVLRLASLRSQRADGEERSKT